MHQIRRGLASTAILHELEPDHEAETPDMADRIVPGREFLRAVQQPFAHPDRVVPEFLFDDVQGR